MIGLIMELEWVYSPMWLLACVALGVAAALQLYFKSTDFEEVASWQKLLMAVLRFITVTTLAALLLTPIIKMLQSHTERKNIVFLQDNSASLRASHDTLSLREFDKQTDALLSELETQVNTAKFRFDEATTSSIGPSFDGKTTNISSAIQQIKEQYSIDRLSAIIVASDGIYNEGQNPFYQSGLERTPIYVLAMGDTTAGADAEVQRVFHNRVVYKGDEFEVEADISASGLRGNRGQAIVSLISNGKSTRLASQPMNVDKSDFFTTIKFKLKANTAGVNRYRVHVPVLSGEDNKSNNYFDFFVEVIESRQKILLLANAPHPDLNALKNSLENLKNYEVEIQYAKRVTSNFRAYDLVVMHNLPSGKFAMKSALSEINRNNIPLLFIVGTKTNLALLNSIQNVVKIQQAQNQFTDAEPALNPNFNLFSINNEIRQFVSNLPPLHVPFGSFSPSAGYDVLFKQEIKNISTNYPLIILGETGGNKKGVVTGDGLWKWRMYDYAQNKSFERSDELISKIFQYLAVTGDKRRFKIENDRAIYDENDRVFLTAEFYNASYELKNEGDIDLKLTNDKGETSSFAFSKTDNAYALDLGRMAPGDYRYNGQLQDGGQRYTASGRLTVRPLVAELQHVRADHQLLKNLASASGGKVYAMNQLSQLKSDLLDSNIIKPLYLSDYDRTSVLNLKWLLGLLLLTLCGEWFMRKFLGSY